MLGGVDYEWSHRNHEKSNADTLRLSLQFVRTDDTGVAEEELRIRDFPKLVYYQGGAPSIYRGKPPLFLPYPFLIHYKRVPARLHDAQHSRTCDARLPLHRFIHG